MQKSQSISEKFYFGLYILLVLMVFLNRYSDVEISPDLSDSIYFSSKGWYNVYETLYYKLVFFLFENELSHKFLFLILSVGLVLILERNGLKWTIAIFLLDPFWFMSVWQFVQISIVLLLYFSRSRILKLLSFNIHIVSFGLLLFQFTRKNKYILGLAVFLFVLMTYVNIDFIGIILYKLTYTLEKNASFAISLSIFIRIVLTMALVFWSNRLSIYALVFLGIIFTYYFLPLIGFRLYHLFFYMYLFDSNIKSKAKTRLACLVFPFSMYSLL